MARQAQGKFLEVASGSESLKSDLRKFVSQSDLRWRIIEDRLNILALPAVSAAQEDPMWRRDDPWRRAQTPWSGGAGAALGSSAQEGAAQTWFPGASPRGIAEHQPASQPMQWTYDNHASSRSYTNSEFRPDLRNWKEAQLDLSVKPEIFKAWQLRALRVLSEDRLDIRRLLDWAEKHDTPIDSASAQLGAQKAGFCYWEDVQGISIKLLGVLTHMVANFLIPATQSCGEGHGLELWRSFAARWQAKATKLWPPLCAATSHLHAAPAQCSYGRLSQHGSRRRHSFRLLMTQSQN